MDQELISYLDEQFRSLRQEMADRFENVEGRLGGIEGRLDRVEEGVRHNGVQLEGLRGQVQLVAEAYISLEGRLETLRVDMEAGFKEVRSSVRLPFEHLDSRLRIVEDRAANEGRDVMSLLREKLGKNPL